MLGYGGGELVGKRIWDLVLDEPEKEKLQTFLAREQPAPKPYVTVSRRKDGTPVDTLVDWDYERDDDGRVNGFISVISARQQALKKLQASEERYRALFDEATDGILMARMEDRKFVTGNKAICRMLGYSAEEIARLGVGDIHPEADLPHVIDRFARQARGEFSLARDIPVLRKDGSVFCADISSSKVTIGGEKFVLGIFRDITDLRRLSDESLAARRDWEETLYDPLYFLAAVTAHIPDKGEHLVRYYGWCSSVQRGKRRKPGLEEKPPEAPPIENDTPEARAARRAWARLLWPHADHRLHRGGGGHQEDPGEPEALGGAGTAAPAGRHRAGRHSVRPLLLLVDPARPKGNSTITG